MFTPVHIFVCFKGIFCLYHEAVCKGSVGYSCYSLFSDQQLSLIQMLNVP